MDEEAKEVLKIVAGVALQPATELIDNVIGVLGGDALGDFRDRQRERRRQRHTNLSQDAIRLLQHRDVKEPVEPNAAAVDELAEAAQNEPREELRALWAALLAAMFDPARAPAFRREFIGIAKQLEPIDAAILPRLDTNDRMQPNRRAFLATELKRSEDEIELAFRNLTKLELVRELAGGGLQNQPSTTSLGKQFLAAVLS